MPRLLPALLLVLASVAGCVLSDELQPIETHLDQQSAITVETMGQPYIFATDAAGLAANARDYLDLRVLEIDQMGKRVYLLSLVAFSTVDRRGRPNPNAGALGTVSIKVGERSVELSAIPAGTDTHGLSERVYPRRNGQVATAEYLVTPDFIRELAAAGESRLAIDLGGGELHYQPWEPAAAGLKAFAERLPRGAH